MLQFLLILIILIVIVSITTGGKLQKLNNANKRALVMCLIFLGVIAAFRSPVVGNDTEEYIRIFDFCEELLNYGSRFEKGYLYFNFLVYRIYPHSQFLFIVTSVFFYFSLGRLMWRYSTNPCLSLLFFFVMSYGLTLSMIRQFMAMCILMYSFDFIIKKQWIKFVLVVLIASLFHISAILFMIMFPVSYMNIRTKTLYIFIIAALFGYIFFADILAYLFSTTLFSSYEHYSEGKYFEGDTRLASILNLLLSIIYLSIAFIAYYRTTITWKISEQGEKYKFLLLLQLMTVVFNVMCLRVNLLDRIALYFSIYSFILLPNAITLLSKDKQQIIGTLLFLLLLSYSSAIIMFRPGWNRVYPIELYWGL